MTAWVRIFAAGIWLLVACAAASAQQQMPEGWDRYLGHPRGPYRGQIVDAQTKAPLPGAVVVALWRRDRVYPFQVNSEHYAVRETVTDSEGNFVMDVRDIEDGAPRRTRKPEFLIFLPGYGAFPRRHTSPQGFIAEIFNGSGSSVEVPRLVSRRERLDNLSAASPYRFSETPFKDLPRLMKAVDEERISLGLEPYSQPEKE
jgi:hypothetical protein